MTGSPLRRGYRTYRRDGLRWLSIRGFGHAVFGRENCPESLRWRLGRRYYRRAMTFDTDEYAAPLDPFEIAFVDPSRITHTTMREYPPWGGKQRLFGAVRDGDWDRPDPDATLPYEFCERPIYQIFHARFEEGKAWAEIDGIQRRLRSVENGKSTWRNCTSREDVFRRCAYCDDLYESLRTEGCRTQRELGPRNREPGFMPGMAEEILVDVGRNGELLHVGGMHRLAIAKLLELPEIPVAFLVRHADWMAYRDEVYERGLAADHPDLDSLAG